MILRLISLFQYQFTYDELSGLERTQFNSFAELIEKGVKIDAHPLLVQFIIFCLVKSFGYVTWIVKLPFLLFGFASVIYIYALGLKNFSKQVGLLASVILSFSLIFVFYAPIARMYISGVFFSSALLYYFFEIVFSESTKRIIYFFFGLFAWLCALNHHMSALFAFTVYASGFFFLRKRNLRIYLLTGVLTLAVYLPVLPVTLYQLGLAGIGYEQGGWLGAPDYWAIFTFIKVILGTGQIYLLVLVFCLISLVPNLSKGFVLSQNRSLQRKQIFLLLIFVVNYLIIYFYSIFRAPVFQNSVMLFSGTALVLFFCSLINFRNVRVFYTCFILLVSALIYRTYFYKDYYHQSVKTVYEYQFERTIHYKKKYGDKNVYPLFFDADNIMKKIYFEKYGKQFDCKISSDSVISYGNRTYFKNEKRHLEKDSVVSSIRLFSEFVSSMDCDYVVMSSSTPLYESIVMEYFPYLLENTQTQGIYYKLYSKRDEDKNNEVANDQVVFYSNPFSGTSRSYSYTEVKPPFVRNTPHKIDSVNEFPPGIKINYDKLRAMEGEMLLARAVIEPVHADQSQLELCIHVADSAGKSYAYSSKSLSDFKMRSGKVSMYSDQFIGTSHKDVADQTVLSYYLWNRGKENHAMLNVELLLIDYWHSKWHFWD
jgi:hypothetical protein